LGYLFNKVVRIRNKKKIVLLIAFGVLAVLNLFSWLVAADWAKQKPLTIIFFNVGQGDAVFVETPRRQQILIDGGPDSSVLAKLAKVMPFYDRSIDLVILSHPEKDHLAGLLEVLKRYKVENIIWTGVVRDIPEWQEWERLLKGENAKIKIAHSGLSVVLDGREFSSHFDIIYPFENFAGQKIKDSNDTSAVGRLVFGNNSFLFAGDIGKSVEQKLIGCDIDSDILKIAHHGSRYSSSEEFLAAVSPEIAVIPVGRENSYGHPHPDILARLRDFGIDIRRTDQDGDIKIISNGRQIKILKK